MFDVFVSYARDDEDRVKELARALEQRGLSVFWDRTIPPGQTWRSHIGDALNDARCVIVAWSHHSVKSRWVIEEAEEGLQRDALLPLLFDDVVPPLGFRSIQAADLTGVRSGQASQQLQEFVNAVYHRLSGTSGFRQEKDVGEALESVEIGEVSTAPRADTRTSPRRALLWTSAGVTIAVATLIGGATGLVMLRHEAVTRQSVAPSAGPSSTLDPPRAQEESVGVANPLSQEVIVIFRDGSQQLLDEVAFAPGAKVCYRGLEVRGAIERAGGVPILQTDPESEELLQRGYCDARTLFLAER